MLGPAVDLIMLREFVGDLRRRASRRRRSITCKTAIDAQLGDLMKDARKAGRDSFRQKPTKFGKRLTKAVRRDLAPIDEADGNGNGELGAE